MDEINYVESVKFALEWCKHLTTLTTATLVLSATFLKDIFSSKSPEKLWLLFSAWVCLLISISAGILFMGSLCAQLASNKTSELDIYASPGNFLAIFQNLGFFLGVLAFAWFIGVNAHHFGTRNKA